VIKVAN